MDWLANIKSDGIWLDNVELNGYTSWRVGGKTQLLYKPRNAADLIATLKQLPDDIAITWLGLGSNTLVRDGGTAGVTIITQGNLNELQLLNCQQVKVQAGVACAQMARFCARNNLAKAEFWAGIPGTMGGALRMNAGCFDGETWENLVSVETINRFGDIRQKSPSEFSVAYRHVEGLAKDEWFLSATFELPVGEKQASLQTIKNLLARRSATQPTGEYNCGSVFRNPEGDFAARLIESCGLKGYKVGGAFVSTKHANFITNDGHAKALDIEKLIDHVQQQVFVKTGVHLKREVHVIGSSL